MSFRRYRGLCECGEHAWCVLTKGYVTFVSPEDVDLLRWRKWHVTLGEGNYMRFYATTGGRRGRRYQLHRMILREPTGDIDHKDHNGLNNRRNNLRLCTRSQNSGNSRQRLGRSGFRGVYQATRSGRWCACIAHQHLGTFDTPDEAACAYDAAAIKRFGEEFATTNVSLGLLVGDQLVRATLSEDSKVVSLPPAARR